MHKYKVLETEILGNEQGVSGSQIKRILDDPHTEWSIKKGLLPKPIFNHYQKEAMKAGTYWESKHIEYVNQNADLAEIKIHKTTLQSLDNPLWTLNIDGYIGKDINDIDTLIEVKNIVNKIDEYEQIIENYKWQMFYSLWFTNAKKGIFIISLRGRLPRIFIMNTIDKIKEIEGMLTKLTIFTKQLVDNVEPQKVIFAKKELENVSEKQDFQHKSNIDEYIALKDEIKFKTESLKELEQTLKSTLPLNITYQHPTLGYKLSFFSKKSTGYVSWTSLVNDLCVEHNLDFKELKEQYKGESALVNVLEVKKSKGTK